MDFKNGLDLFKIFQTLHKDQLESSGVPSKYWLALHKKIENNIFDVEKMFSIHKIEHNGEKQDKDPSHTLIVTKSDGIDCNDSSQIYLIDHAWTFECNRAEQYLTNIEGLCKRMCKLMNLPLQQNHQADIKNVFREMWKFSQTYSYSIGQSENKIPLWYIMDKFGSAIEHSDVANFRCVPFYHLSTEVKYSLLFPIKNIKPMEKVTRDYLEGSFSQDESLRKALILPWRPSSFLSIDFNQTEPDLNYYMSQLEKDSLPSGIDNATQTKNKPLKVYTECEQIYYFLWHPAFQVVETSDDADILWLTRHFKDYKTFSEEHPSKFINQFPFEGIITKKNLLPIVSRRKQDRQLNQFADNPRWFPTTYDLSTDLVKFVSFFQHREKAGLDNIWICKPLDLPRGRDIVITDNINCIVRLPFSGPKLAQKYVGNPLLFDREDVGRVKFDVRYTVLLKSVQPLCVYAYKNFFLRFATKPYELAEFWDTEKHHPVMNYDTETPSFNMSCEEFVNKFNTQNPTHQWEEVEKEIFRAFIELFQAATMNPPPLGIGPNEQSRAMYGIDLILTIEKNSNDDDVVQPKILEVNWMPDCEKASRLYPTFFDDIFLLLFSDQYDESKFKLL
ncbi:hypothetical protein RUM43_007537 [Polyplax serrata]|uniref:Tubulin--tyrosine ligase-like protein 12 SET-like domain-containing protein n=1 Tax=Polyplax serrata TaxID=468196 RepID=A0AAN8P5U2_POLSC